MALNSLNILTILWRTIYYAWVVSEVWIALATRTWRGSGSTQGRNSLDRGSFLILWVVIFSAMFAGSWFSDTHGSNLPGGARWLWPVSLAILVAGLAIRWTAVRSLGKSFSSNVAIHSTQTLRTTGLYRWMRHPSYTGLLMAIVAAGLHTRNSISLAVMVIPSTAALLYRIHVEEIALGEAFGPAYEDYCRRTSRLIPGIY